MRRLARQKIEAASMQALQVVSGHIHAFEALAIAYDGPSQLVVGTWGTSLDPQISQSLACMTTGSALVEDGVSQSHLGFVVLEQIGATGASESRFRGIAAEAELACEGLGGRGVLTFR